jgi:hypothetical protein
MFSFAKVLWLENTCNTIKLASPLYLALCEHNTAQEPLKRRYEFLY